MGKLITFEGGEGAGKTTAVRNIFEWLQGELTRRSLSHKVRVTREPGDSDLGRSLRGVVLGNEMSAIAEVLLYAADRSEHVETKLKPWLRDGDFVLCDRFVDSAIAYQGFGRGIDLAIVERLNNIATGGIKPDLTFWLDVDVEIGLQRTRQRGKSDRFEQSSLEFHNRVRDGFRTLAMRSDRFVRIDARLDEESITHQIKGVLVGKICEWF